MARNMCGYIVPFNLIRLISGLCVTGEKCISYPYSLFTCNPPCSCITSLACTPSWTLSHEKISCSQYSKNRGFVCNKMFSNHTTRLIFTHERALISKYLTRNMQREHELRSKANILGHLARLVGTEIL